MPSASRVSAPSQDPPGDPAPLPAPAPPEPARGISFSNWLSHPEAPPEHLDGFITAEDFQFVASLGFTHVRIPIHPSLLQEEAPPFRPREDGFHRLDRALDWAERHRLACVLDLYPRPPLDGSPAALSALCVLWGRIAARCRERTTSLFYELLHEPKIADAAAWGRIAAQLLRSVRAEDPNSTAIIPGPGRCGPTDLAALHPLEDARLVYSFHFYDPLTFTLQGSPCEGGQYAPLRAVPYPADPAYVNALIAHLSAHCSPPRLPSSPHNLDAETAEALRRSLALQKALRPLREYGDSGCDRGGLARYMEPAFAWAREHRVPLYCSQFGAHQPYAPPDSRRRWLADVTSLLTAAGAGWALWEYQGSFGLLECSDGGERIAHRPLLDALRLPADRANGFSKGAVR